MIKSSHPISPSAVQTLEDALYELAPSNWSLIVSQKDGGSNLEGFFDSAADAHKAQLELESILGNKFEEPFKFDQVEDKDWKESYKNHFTTWSQGTIHWVPEWERESYVIPPGHHALYVDPGMAFGTGNHETTRLCLESMISICEKKKVVDCMDIGCGSGILALSATLLGIGNVKAVDVDPDAIKVSRDNANLNRMTKDVDFQISSLENLEKEKRYDLVLANIQADILMKNSETLIRQVRTDGFLVLSGILANEMDELELHFKNQLSHIGIAFEHCTRKLNEWSALQIKLSD